MKNGGHKGAETVLKRFYQGVLVKEFAEGWQVLLDGRSVKTPKRAALVLPTKALAEAIAAEWEAQQAIIDPRTMRLTKLANSTLDGVIGKEDAVRKEIIAYAANDLLCYRAERPQELARQQQEHWDPLLDWVRERFGSRLVTTTGLMPVAQPQDSLACLGTALDDFDAFALAACHVMTSLTGSAVLVLAHIEGRLTVSQAWNAAHVDEDFQTSRWGEDAEAKQRRDLRYAEMAAAAAFFAIWRSGS